MADEPPDTYPEGEEETATQEPLEEVLDRVQEMFPRCADEVSALAYTFVQMVVIRCPKTGGSSDASNYFSRSSTVSLGDANHQPNGKRGDGSSKRGDPGQFLEIDAKITPTLAESEAQVFCSAHFKLLLPLGYPHKPLKLVFGRVRGLKTSTEARLKSALQELAVDAPHDGEEEEDMFRCMNIIQRALDLLTEFNECPEERGECMICLDGFTKSTLSVAMENAATCASCRSMFHGSCLAEHWWRFNVRRMMRSFNGSNSKFRNFYFEIGKDLSALETACSRCAQQESHADVKCRSSETKLAEVQREQETVMAIGGVLNAVTKQRLVNLKVMVERCRSEVNMDRSLRKQARQNLTDAKWKWAQLKKDMADLDNAVAVLMKEVTDEKKTNGIEGNAFQLSVLQCPVCRSGISFGSIKRFLVANVPSFRGWTAQMLNASQSQHNQEVDVNDTSEEMKAIIQRIQQYHQNLRDQLERSRKSREESNTQEEVDNPTSSTPVVKGNKQARDAPAGKITQYKTREKSAKTIHCRPNKNTQTRCSRKSRGNTKLACPGYIGVEDRSSSRDGNAKLTTKSITQAKLSARPRASDQGKKPRRHRDRGRSHGRGRGRDRSRSRGRGRGRGMSRSSGRSSGRGSGQGRSQDREKRKGAE